MWGCHTERLQLRIPTSEASERHSPIIGLIIALYMQVGRPLGNPGIPFIDLWREGINHFVSSRAEWGVGNREVDPSPRSKAGLRD